MPKMPVVFFGHGNPMNALQENAYTRAWKKIGAQLPRPRAILSLSAHWYVPALRATAMPWPRTIHDFGGFPDELYAVDYPAPGDPALARRIAGLLGPLETGLDQNWGLDHGTWSVLCRVFPKADIPVVQLSLDARRPPEFHYELGKKLMPLRSEGILIAGSGNVVHNLGAYAWDEPGLPPLAWAGKFEAGVRRLLAEGRDREVIDYPALGPEAALAVPTPEHFLPLLYILGARGKEEPVHFPVEGFDGGSLSMLAVQAG